ncbi:Flp family type IVb pilin [Cohaesibacter gelatinilyticus]|uniref:Pilus assembly protein Flp/PilA n=1 Tax=Cohaesibacter gelatinilyticus TaxID=372072 RepID=A0A285PH16_9HYPH|nr:Flp family type IVb pilin [Cohaesibacter gelatinilyticus]SNZ20708.1 pilus assembly protein Flp/PilA [Cohaesibacter gelatinilyticus]HAT86028.1 Flp family type IVb pilin [Hyphomicrobiales bacterium]
MKNFARFLNDESGATAIEYALLAGLIGVGIVAAAGTLEDAITALFNRIGTALGAAAV